MKISAQIITCLLVGALMVVSVAGSVAAEEKTARIAYTKWACATAAANVVKAVLQEKMGYTCELEARDVETTWLLTADGTVDGFVSAWLPSLHQYFYGKVGDNVVDLGPNLEGTRVGLVVPDYVTIDSIDQLAEQAEKFNHRIIGIGTGAGIMRLTREAIKDYHLENMELIPGSGASMEEALAGKIENREWVVVTGWTPHWKFARWDLKYLQDPGGVYGDAEAIHTVVGKDLKKDKPRLYRFLDNFYWQPQDIHRVMAMIQESGDPYDSAVEWINRNPDKVDAWLAEE